MRAQGTLMRSANASADVHVHFSDPSISVAQEHVTCMQPLCNVWALTIFCEWQGCHLWGLVPVVYNGHKYNTPAFLVGDKG